MGKSSPAPAPPPVDQAALIDKQAEVNRITEITPLGSNVQGTFVNGRFVPSSGGAATQVNLTPETQQLFDLATQASTVLGERGLQQAEGLPAGPIDFSGLPEFQSGIDFSALPGLLGFDPSQFTGIPSSIDSSEFGALPGAIDRSGLPALAGGLDTSGFSNLPSGFDFDALTAIPGVDDFSADRERVEQATFQRAKGLLDPEFLRQQNRLEQSLANRGLPSGGEAFDDEFSRFEDSRNRAFQDAAFQAVQAGGAEQSRLFGLATAARAQQFGEQIQSAAQQFGVRSVEFQEALAGLSQALGARGQLVAEQLQDIATQFGVRSTQFQEALASAQQAVQARGIEFGEAQFGSNLEFQTRQQALAEALQGVDLSRTARQQGISEITGERSLEFAELASLLGLAQPALPTFNAPSDISVLGPAALAQASALEQQRIAAQQNSGFLSGLFGLGSSAITAGLPVLL